MKKLTTCPNCQSIKLEPINEYISEQFARPQLWQEYFCHGCGHYEQMRARLPKPEEKDHGFS